MEVVEVTMCDVFTIIPVCLPDSNDGYIKVGFPVHIAEKDDTGHLIRIDTEIERAIERQAEIFRWTGKLTYADGVAILAGSLSKEEQDAGRYNERLVSKLKQMTTYDYYNKKR